MSDDNANKEKLDGTIAFQVPPAKLEPRERNKEEPSGAGSTAAPSNGRANEEKVDQTMISQVVAPKFELRKKAERDVSPTRAEDALRKPAGEGKSDSTMLVDGAAPPEIPHRPAAPPVRPGGAEQSDRNADYADDATVRIPIEPSLPPLYVRRVHPDEHKASERLKRSVSLVVGRAVECDLRLYTQSASRKHAEIKFRGDGWYLSALPGKRVHVDGDLLRGQVRLRDQMQLRFGDDELVVVDPKAPGTSPTLSGQRVQQSRRQRFAYIVAVVVGLGLVASISWWVFRTL